MKTIIIPLRPSIPERRFSVVIAGDFCPREENSADVSSRAEKITAGVKPYFEEADLRLLQWECAVTRSDTPIDKTGPNHRCAPECIRAASALRVDAVLLANNHIGDYGTPGLADTLAAFRDNGIATVGAGMNLPEALEPLRSPQCTVFNAAEYEFGMADNESAGAHPLDEIRLSAQIREEKSRSRRVIVTLHGGQEHFPFPSPLLRQRCRFLAECGADAVFNCHSHCPAGYEIWHGVPIVYSPGNFYFPGRPASLPCWRIGYLPKFHFDADGAYALEVLPYYNFPEEIQPMNEKDTVSFELYLKMLSEPISDDRALQKIFDAWCVSGLPGGYFGVLFGRALPESLQTRKGVRDILEHRNLFTCQSHQELLRNTLLLIERYQLDAAREMLPILQAAREPSWVKKQPERS